MVNVVEPFQLTYDSETNRLTDLGMNARALSLADRSIERAAELRVAAHMLASGARVVDAGIEVPGGFAAGRVLAELCMGGLGEVARLGAGRAGWPSWLQVHSSQPVLACMASQYAGWSLAASKEDTGGKKFFALGSGPARALDTIGGQVTWQSTAFGSLLVGLMSMFLVARHTRAAEESGRDELVRAAPVGRFAGVAAAALEAAIANVVAGAAVSALKGAPAAAKPCSSRALAPRPTISRTAA